MSRTFTNLLTHLVFSTKDREPLIVSELKPELYAYLVGWLVNSRESPSALTARPIIFIC